MATRNMVRYESENTRIKSFRTRQLSRLEEVVEQLELELAPSHLAFLTVSFESLLGLRLTAGKCYTATKI